MRKAKKNNGLGIAEKKKRHTMKIQLLIHATTHIIMCVATGKGATHDLTLFRNSGCHIHEDVALVGDAGYQGVKENHPYALTPHKSSKNHPLTEEKRLKNRALASFRQPVEHVIRKLKIFRVLKEVYRHRRRRFGLRLSLIAGILNYSNQASA